MYLYLFLVHRYVFNLFYIQKEYIYYEYMFSCNNVVLAATKNSHTLKIKQSQKYCEMLQMCGFQELAVLKGQIVYY